MIIDRDWQTKGARLKNPPLDTLHCPDQSKWRSGHPHTCQQSVCHPHQYSLRPVCYSWFKTANIGSSSLLSLYLHPPCHWGAVLGCDGGGGGVHQGVQTELNSWWSWWCCWWWWWYWWRCWWCVRNITWPQGSSGQDDDVTPQLESPSQADICLSSFSPTWALFISFVFLFEESWTWEHEREVKVHWSLQDACQGYLVGSDKYLVQVHCTQAQVQVWYLAAINNMINIHSSISSTFVLKMPSLISASTSYLTWISQRQEWYREDKGRAELDTTSRVQIWKEKDKICRRGL